jgi:fructokinase
MICAWYGQFGNQIDNASFLKERFNLKGILVTRGANGAFFIDENFKLSEHQGFKVIVNDTIGSGDSFLAAFITKWLSGERPAESLKYACAVGAFVATQKGATPEMVELLELNLAS